LGVYQVMLGITTKEVKTRL